MLTFSCLKSLIPIRQIKLISLTGVCLLSLCFAQNIVLAQDRLILSPYQASYYLKGWGVLEIERTVTLTRDRETYTLRSTNKATGLASLSGYGPVIEESTFLFSSGIIRPISYRNVDESGLSKLNDWIEFEWTTKLARSQRKGETYVFPIEGELLDPLTIELRVRLDLANGLKAKTYQVHEVEQIRTYKITHLPIETVKIGDSNFSTNHLIIDTGRINRELHYWLAPTLDYLPIKLQQLHGGKSEAKGILTSSSTLDQSR